MATPLPVNILCGYLGAGKTTLLNRLLMQAEERVLVMVNDFGDINVDAALVSARSADTIQLSNGCICCSMGAGLFEAFDRALSLANRVDRLVIEASGVAEPERLATFARAEPDLSCRAVVAVVDPGSISARLGDPRVGGVLHRQIEGADLVYLSRGDVVPAAEMAAAEALVQAINPVARCFRDAGPDFMAALDAAHDGAMLSPFGGSQTPFGGEGDHGRIFARRSIVARAAPDRAAFLDRLRAQAGSVHRLKGFVRFADGGKLALVQLAGGRVEVSDAPEDGDPAAVRLVAIGPDAGALDRLAAALAG